MNLEVIYQLFETCFIPLLGALTAWLCVWIKNKCDETSLSIANETEKKYLKMLEDTICACVVATNQTYVDSLKAQGKFDSEAQKNAFAKTLCAVLDVLTEDAYDYLSEAVGDLQQYITNKIEAQVNIDKK